MLDLGKLETLKRLLVEATDFFEVYGYFMDHFGEQPEMLKLGRPMHDPTFIQVIEQLGARVTGQKEKLTQPIFLRLPAKRFVHGAFTYGDHHVGSVFYFEEIEKGLAAFGPLGSEGPTEMVRFSLAQLAGKGYTLH